MAALRATLRDLPRNLVGKVVRPALRAGTKIVLAEVRKDAPVGNRKWTSKRGRGKVGGLLKASLAIKAKRRSRKAIGYAVSTSAERFRGVDAFYGAFVEFGHKIGKRPLGIRRQRGVRTEDGRREVPGLHFIERAGKRVEEHAAATAIREMRQRVALLKASPLR
jgi:hypothetical protein